jgi:hypothetical protein
VSYSVVRYCPSLLGLAIQLECLKQVLVGRVVMAFYGRVVFSSVFSRVKCTLSTNLCDRQTQCATGKHNGNAKLSITELLVQYQSPTHLSYAVLQSICTATASQAHMPLYHGRNSQSGPTKSCACTFKERERCCAFWAACKVDAPPVTTAAVAAQQKPPAVSSLESLKPTGLLGK